mmetsp:Transcript_26696/g.48956  ORF Transcript_26696/g.48956 Transcript_26696/m.48956 type:complete len:278 (-) Transcript_26696:91-924(-)
MAQLNGSFLRPPSSIGTNGLPGSALGSTMAGLSCPQSFMQALTPAAAASPATASFSSFGLPGSSALTAASSLQPSTAAAAPALQPTAAIHQSAAPPAPPLQSALPPSVPGGSSLTTSLPGQTPSAAVNAQAYQDAMAASAVAASAASAYQQIWAGYLAGMAATQNPATAAAASSAMASGLDPLAASGKGMGKRGGGRGGKGGVGRGGGRTGTGPPKPRPPPALPPGLLNQSTATALGLEKPLPVPAAPPATAKAQETKKRPAPETPGIIWQSVKKAA